MSASPEFTRSAEEMDAAHALILLGVEPRNFSHPKETPTETTDPEVLEAARVLVNMKNSSWDLAQVKELKYGTPEFEYKQQQTSCLFARRRSRAEMEKALGVKRAHVELAEAGGSASREPEVPEEDPNATDNEASESTPPRKIPRTSTTAPVPFSSSRDSSKTKTRAPLPIRPTRKTEQASKKIKTEKPKDPIEPHDKTKDAHWNAAEIKKIGVHPPDSCDGCKKSREGPNQCYVKIGGSKKCAACIKNKQSCSLAPNLKSKAGGAPTTNSPTLSITTMSETSSAGAAVDNDAATAPVADMG